MVVQVVKAAEDLCEEELFDECDVVRQGVAWGGQGIGSAFEPHHAWSAHSDNTFAVPNPLFRQFSKYSEKT